MLSDEIDASSGRRIGNLKLGVGIPASRWIWWSRLDRSLSPAMQAFNDFLTRDGSRYLPASGELQPARAS